MQHTNMGFASLTNTLQEVLTLCRNKCLLQLVDQHSSLAPLVYNTNSSCCAVLRPRRIPAVVSTCFRECVVERVVLLAEYFLELTLRCVFLLPSCRRRVQKSWKVVD